MDAPTGLASLARMIDHSLLHPALTDRECDEGCALARERGAAAVCVKPHMVETARAALAGSRTAVCAVTSFPHGNAAVVVKVAEALQAMDDGATEIDSVVTVGKVLGGEWDYVDNEIRALKEAVRERGALLKVIFETGYLNDDHIRKLCDICAARRVAFVKTSTGFGYVRRPDGSFAVAGATEHAVRLMREVCPPAVKVKAAGGIRTLDELLAAASWGADRIGTSSTGAILEEARKRGYT